MTVAEYNTCVETNADALYRFILKSTKDSERARDIVQDAYEKMWKKAENVEASKAKSYLFQTAYNRMIDVFRKENRMGAMDESMESQLKTTQGGYSDLKEILDEAVNKLPEIQKSVLMLRDYEGYNYKEIGEMVNLNEGQVKVYIFRARKFLKQYLGSVEKVL